MRRGIRWVCAMAAAGAIGGFAQQSQALTVAQAIAANYSGDPNVPIIFEDSDLGLRVSDDNMAGGIPGIVGDFVFSVVEIQQISNSGYDISSPVNSIKGAPIDGIGGTNMGTDGNSELTILVGGQIIGIVPAAGGVILQLGAIAGNTWTLGAGPGETFTVPAGISGGSVVALVFEDATPDFAGGSVAAAIASATNGTLIAAAGFTSAPVIGAANAAGEFFLNTEDGDPDAIVDAFELNLNFLDVTGVAGANQVLGPANTLPNDLGPGAVPPYSVFVPDTGFGTPNVFGAGAQLYAKGTFSPETASSPWDINSDGDFYVLIPTPAAVIPGLAVLGMLALRRPRREEA